MSRWPLRVAVYLALALGLTWPVAAAPFTRVPGAARTDLWDSLWGLWFVAHSVAAGELPWRTTLMGWPDGGVLVVADPVNSLLGLPLVLLVGVPFAYSVLVVAHVLFSALAAHALAEELFDGPGPGWVAGVGWAAAPVMISAIHNGTSEAIAGGWLALSVYAVLRAVRLGGAWRCGLAGMAMAVCAWGSWYAGLCAWIAWTAVLLLCNPGGRFARRLGRMAGVAAVALALTAPVALAMQQGSTSADNLVGIKHPKELMSVRRTIGAADPRGWFAVGDFRSPDFRVLSRYGEEFIHCHYLGWSLIFAAFVASWRTREGSAPPRARGALALAGLVGLLLAMGPVVAMDGQALILRGRLAIPLPYFLLERLPGFSGLSLLYRLAMLPSLVLAVLAGGLVAGRFSRWSPILAALVLLDLRVLSPTHGMPDTEDVEVAEPLRWLADAPNGAVMNFPVVGGRAYLWEQTTHGKPIAGNLNFPNNPASRRVWGAMLDAERAGLAPEDARSAVSAAARKEGIRYLVVHVDAMARPDMHDAAVHALKQWFDASAETPAVKVYELW